MEVGTSSLARPASTPAKRARTYYGYSRTGCARCKQQRVRCDERHPECERCTRAGISCPGFAPRLRWSVKHEKFRPPPSKRALTSKLARPQRNRPTSGATEGGLQPQIHLQTLKTGSPVATAEASERMDSAHVTQGDSMPSPALGSVWNSLFAQCFPLPQDGRDLFMDIGQHLQPQHHHDDSFLGEELLSDEFLQMAPERVGTPTATVADQKTATSQGGTAAYTTEDPDNAEIEENLPLSPVSPSLSDAPSPPSSAESRPAAEPPNARQLPHKAVSEFIPTSKASSMYLPAPSTAIRDVSSGLVEFYFKETARVFSCFDSRMNPFRTAVVRVWSSSRLIYCTLQSMAAACLVDDFPHLGPVGQRLRREAVQQLSETTTLGLHAMLAMLMLGGTASWHDPCDLGLPFFNFLVRRLAAAPPAAIFGGEAGGNAATATPTDDTSTPSTSDDASGIDQRNYRFFYESMLYWEMLLAFVADSSSSSSSGGSGNKNLPTMLDAPFPTAVTASPTATTPAPLSTSTSPTTNPQLAHLRHPQRGHALGPAPPHRVPHPWTGFAADTQRAVQQVGRLVRQQRKAAYTHVFTSTAHIRQLQRDMASARQLEACLVSIVHPDETTVADTGDRDTPVWHLLALAEIIRAVGLVQLYHVFPDLLRARLALEREGDGDRDGDRDGDVKKGLPEDDTLSGSRWLTAYALRTLDMMRSIPIESGTRDWQPFLLVALSSELRTEPPPDPNDIRPDDVDLQAVEVLRARSFIRSRLMSFMHVLPPKPMSVSLKIVQATWARMDEQTVSHTETGVYWMDVMIENGWETTMA